MAKTFIQDPSERLDVIANATDFLSERSTTIDTTNTPIWTLGSGLTLVQESYTTVKAIARLDIASGVTSGTFCAVCLVEDTDGERKAFPSKIRVKSACS